ncbi:MAG: patatin-like phospholipase family protein [Verrucomicrobiia bacterium]
MPVEPESLSTLPTSPVRTIPSDAQEPGPEPGIALCLSGGGYRAMIFHLGALIRLNEAGILKKLSRVSSVSGGSITSGCLGLAWRKLSFSGDRAMNLDTQVIQPVRKLAGETIDDDAVIGGIFLPGTISDRIVSAYQKHVFGNATLQDLPDDASGPRFVINATNVQTGSLWRFSRPYMADWRVGRVMKPDVKLAVAVAASSAFPPVLSPLVMELDPDRFEREVPPPQLQGEPYTSRVVLTDGGVYDNLGLETAWKRCRTVLVSDGGGKLSAEPEPKRDWARHSVRVLGLIDSQVRSLRKRQIMAAFNEGREHNGTYWGIFTNIADYGLADALNCPLGATTRLAETPTRLKRLDARAQERLINWGYAVCDAALRRFAAPGLEAYGISVNQRPSFPYRDVGV